MILNRILIGAAAIAAIMAAAGCAVVALCFAIYALLRDYITPAGASAVIVLICAIIAGVSAWVLASKLKPAMPARRRPEPPASFSERAIDLVRDHPLAAAGAAVAAGAAAFANPALVTAVLRAFTDRKRNRN